MAGDPTYVLDANVFIEAARRYYAFDLASRFWQSLLHHAANERVRSIDRVQQELERGKDELAKWVEDNFSHALGSTDETDVIQSFSEIMTWVQAQRQFSEAAKADFANGADGWLVAYARVKGCVIVTRKFRHRMRGEKFQFRMFVRHSMYLLLIPSKCYEGSECSLPRRAPCPDLNTAKIDALITKIHEGIEKLKEYRTALISAAVTGKIDMRKQT